MTDGPGTSGQPEPIHTPHHGATDKVCHPEGADIGWQPAEYVPPTHEDIDFARGEVKISFPPIKDHRTGRPPKYYPQRDSYEFQEFAGPVFELGGYGDITLVNPYNGMRMWVSSTALIGTDDTTYDWMIKAIEIAKECHFLERDSQTGEVVADMEGLNEVTMEHPETEE
jgi:hypothetical protein